MIPTIKIQLMSDLQLKNPKACDFFEVTPHAPYLALIGDIGCVKDDGLFDFLKALLNKFRLVFFLLGNHEPYGSDWDHTKTTMRKIALDTKQLLADDPTLGEFIFLDRSRHDISDQVITLDCTLYSMVGPTKDDMDRVSFGLNDFYEIRDWTVEQHNEAHVADLVWLNAQVQAIATEEPHRRVVILTHHIPTQDPQAIDPAHARSPITSGFSTDLSKEACWTEEFVKLDTHISIATLDVTSQTCEW